MQRGLFITIGLLSMVIGGFMPFLFTGGDHIYTVWDIKDKMDNGDSMLILDVRTPEEFNGGLGHLPGAKLIPLHEIRRRVDELNAYEDKEIVVICRTDNRSRAAASFLRDAGFRRVSYVRGGMLAWNRQFGKPEIQTED